MKSGRALSHLAWDPVLVAQNKMRQCRKKMHELNISQCCYERREQDIATFKKNLFSIKVSLRSVKSLSSAVL